LSSYTAYEPSALIGHYAITKTALVALTKLLAKELMDEGIRVNAIAPGLIKTKFSSVLWEKDEEESIKRMKVNRLGLPEDIANVTHFLLSTQSAYMTGECLAVAGKPISRL
jgi:dehydrogenase/reductase SDR family protein 4